jgi:hypothetical protein
VSRFKAIRFIAAARVLACVLAGALLLFELVAANSELHQKLHHSGKATSNSCVVCLFAKGQVNSPESAPVFTAPVRIPLDPVLRTESIVMVDVTYLSFPSRAPPAFSSLLSVVG